MWVKLAYRVAVIQLVLGASLIPCPEKCKCQYDNDEIHAVCENFDFLSKLIPKQYSSITHLKITEQSGTISPKLKYLKNLNSLDLSHTSVVLNTLPNMSKLKALDLSHNNLKDIDLSLLPKNIEELNLSNNYLSGIPQDFSHLKNIKSIILNNNPIHCLCDNILLYKELNKHGVDTGDVTCDSGKNIKNIECNPLDIMMGDEGSGDGEAPETPPPEVPLMEEEEQHEENVFLSEEATTTKAPEVIDEQEGSGSSNEDLNLHEEATTTIVPEVIDEQEGIGSSNEDLIPHVVAIDDTNETNETESDEGSGTGILVPDLVDVPKACTENCETPKPVGSQDEENASPLPGLKEQMGILGNDFNIFNEPETTVEITTHTTTTTTEMPIAVTEEVIIKEEETKVEKSSDKTNNYTLHEQTKLGRSSIETSQANSDTIYVIIGVIALALVCLLVFFIKKRGNGKTKSKKPENFGEEMNLMGKSAIQPISEKPVKSEHIPLMNGQNGNLNEKEDFSDVELRPPQENQDLLTPKRERVTIKETEIPDSIPKTPLLVHREKNSEGEIVLTPVENSDD